MAGFVPPVAVSPFTPGSVSVISKNNGVGELNLQRAAVPGDDVHLHAFLEIFPAFTDLFSRLSLVSS